MKLEVQVNADTTIATIKMDEQTIVMPLRIIEDVYRMIESHLRYIERNPTKYAEHKQFGSILKQYGGSHAEAVLNPEKFDLTNDANIKGVIENIERKMKDGDPSMSV